MTLFVLLPQIMLRTFLTIHDLKQIVEQGIMIG